MIEPLYTLRDVDVPVGARTRVRARIEEELARGALPKRHVGRYAFAAAVVAAVIAFVAWPRPPASSHAVVVPAGTQMDFAVATGHSVVHGPAQVGLDAGGLSLASGRVDAQGKLRVRGPSCDVMVDGTAEVSVTDAKLTVRVFAGSVEIVPPVVSCERIDLTPPARSPSPGRTTPTSPAQPVAPVTPTTVTPPATITASAPPPITPSRAATGAAPMNESAPPRASVASSAPARSGAASITSSAPPAAPTAAPREPAANVARVDSTPAIPHAAPAVPSLERIDPPPPPVPHADSAPKLAPPSAPPPVARASSQPAATTTAPSVPASSLAAEELAAALAEYRTAKALETSDPEAAVRAWQAWRAHRSNTPLAHGADLRLLALLHSLHRDAEASELARDFLQRYPNSPRRDDVKRMIERPR